MKTRPNQENSIDELELDELFLTIEECEEFELGDGFDPFNEEFQKRYTSNKN